MAGLKIADTEVNGMDQGVRLRDLDGDGICELIVGSPSQSTVYRRGKYPDTGGRWQNLPFGLPEGTSIVTAKGGDAGLRFADIDDDGFDDVIFSNSKHYGTWMFESMETGWSRRGLVGSREDAGVRENHPRERSVIPPIVRADGSNNGAWI